MVASSALSFWAMGLRGNKKEIERERRKYRDRKRDKEKRSHIILLWLSLAKSCSPSLRTVVHDRCAWDNFTLEPFCRMVSRVVVVAVVFSFDSQGCALLFENDVISWCLHLATVLVVGFVVLAAVVADFFLEGRARSLCMGCFQPASILPRLSGLS